MLLRGSFLPHFRICPSSIAGLQSKAAKSISVFCNVRVSYSFGREAFPASYHHWRIIEVQCNDSSHSIQQSSVTHSNISRLPELSFDRLQLSEQELCSRERRAFGRFVARGAVLDEEYWTAAWLRAEAHWESLSYMRHMDNYKRKFAEQEFYALKHRCSGRHGNSLKCSCLVAELKKANAVLVSHEAYGAHQYAYVANLCVAKYARRQGIATNMLYLASDMAISTGMKQLFVHVNIDNKPAQELYRKAGFQVVEAAPPSKDQRLLMCVEL
ncbi:GCN5-related N-acetyltransferase 6, chloroplastic-like isoform X3 [Aristolochia californica]|uniref:GCN5-related N-acetyltransferase 6, chloroplastic-like isoform X3 n=1 Tax=Aristolochia californica TaxID=171875 RepID=UPI0035D7571E